MKKAIYIASPLGFSEVGRLFMHEKIFPIVKKVGLEIIDPWVLTPQEEIAATLSLPYGLERQAAWRKMNKIIGANNVAGIDRSIGLLAVLDGVDVDSGTASEIGYAFAQGKRILGYRGDFRLAADNEGSIVNLQVEYFVRSNGGEIITQLNDLEIYLTKIFLEE